MSKTNSFVINENDKIELKNHLIKFSWNVIIIDNLDACVSNDNDFTCNGINTTYQFKEGVFRRFTLQNT